MIIVPVPRRFIRTTGWAQSDQRKQLQRSELTGRTRELALGPAERWSCTADVRPVNATDLRIWRGFQARMKQPNAAARVPVAAFSQYGAAANLAPALTAEQAGRWALSTFALRDRSFGEVDGFAPADVLFLTQSPSGISTAQANGGTPIAATPQLYFAEAWGLIGSGTTGTASLRLEWRNSSDAVISTSLLTMDPGSQLNVANQWIRVASSFTAPAGTASVRVFFQAQATASLIYLAAPRVSALPARAVVNGAGQTGQSLSLSGLALSRTILFAGDLLTVTLPSGDEQLIPLTSNLVANGSGIGTAQLGTPMRESPANGAVVELDRPTALMRALDPLAWSSRPGSIHDVRPLQLEEWF